jgi:hypothetical protein
MTSARAALGCLVVAALLAIVCHPRVFFGTGATMSVVSFDDLFFAGQWAALMFALASLVLAATTIRAGAFGTTVLGVLGLSVVVIIFLAATGIPHPANSGAWRNGEVGVRAFTRGMAKKAKAQAKPIHLSADSFAGAWRAPDGTTYTFAADSLSWSRTNGDGEHSRRTCGTEFSIEYLQRERDVLQDHGLTWSAHAVEVYEATSVDAKIPVAFVSCGTNDRFLFIRATAGEVWRWTNAMDANDLKDGSFVLRKAQVSR